LRIVFNPTTSKLDFVGTQDALITQVYNRSGATITKGSVIYLNGSHGNLPTIALAQGNSEATSSRTYGIVQYTLPNNSIGTVIHAGLLQGLDTQSIAVGVPLYLSPIVAGGITSIKPQAPDHMVFIGMCTRAHPTQGRIEVTIANGFELNELHNVQIVSPTDGQILYFEQSSNLWKNMDDKSLINALIFG